MLQAKNIYDSDSDKVCGKYDFFFNKGNIYT